VERVEDLSGAGVPRCAQDDPKNKIKDKAKNNGKGKDKGREGCELLAFPPYPRKSSAAKMGAPVSSA